VTILHIVSKFQIDRACFQGREASENFGGKGEEKEGQKKKERTKERKNRTSSITTESTCPTQKQLFH